MRTAVGRLMIAGLAALAILTGAGLAFGQTVVDATTAEFVPSADHAVLSENGTPRPGVLCARDPARRVVDARCIRSTSANPSPAADGLIRVQFASLLPAPLVGGDTYQARVWAVGPGGSARSVRCRILSPVPRRVHPSCRPYRRRSRSAASTGSITVTAGATCEWTATSNASWLIDHVSDAGNRNRHRYALPRLPIPPPQGRSGTLTIAGQTVTITQAAAAPACTYAINPDQSDDRRPPARRLPWL